MRRRITRRPKTEDFNFVHRFGNGKGFYIFDEDEAGMILFVLVVVFIILEPFLRMWK